MHSLSHATHPFTVEAATVIRVTEEVLNEDGRHVVEVRIKNFLNSATADKHYTEAKHLGGAFVLVKRELITCIVVDTPRGLVYYEVSQPLEIVEEAERAKKALMEKVASAGLTKEDLEAALRAMGG